MHHTYGAAFGAIQHVSIAATHQAPYGTARRRMAVRRSIPAQSGAVRHCKAPYGRKQKETKTTLKCLKIFCEFILKLIL
uniref:Uncharacterized protein n=1 Tax=Romanomermis culicivorax TaxID=13658 RepID=A0A915JW17_ROMCU